MESEILGSTIDLYRSVSVDEYLQIKNTGTFELNGGVEGKHFWERRSDAVRFGMRMGQKNIVRARYRREAAAGFTRWTVLDGIGSARFADAEQMNVGLLEMKLL